MTFFGAPRQDGGEQADIGADIDRDLVGSEKLPRSHHFLLAWPQHRVAHHPVGMHEPGWEAAPDRLAQMPQHRLPNLLGRPRAALTACSKIFYHLPAVLSDTWRERWPESYLACRAAAVGSPVRPRHSPAFSAWRLSASLCAEKGARAAVRIDPLSRVVVQRETLCRSKCPFCKTTPCKEAGGDVNNLNRRIVQILRKARRLDDDDDPRISVFRRPGVIASSRPRGSRQSKTVRPMRAATARRISIAKAGPKGPAFLILRAPRPRVTTRARALGVRKTVEAQPLRACRGVRFR